MNIKKQFLAFAVLRITELCVPVADVAGRRQLRSASQGLWNFPRYNMSNYGRRAFCFVGPYVWNSSLPEHIRQSTSILLLLLLFGPPANRQLKIKQEMTAVGD